MAVVNRSVSGAIGEYFTLAELLKRGYEAYKANGDVQQGWDIVAIDTNRTSADPRITIQVKTIDWPEQCSVNIANGGWSYLVVVLLDRGNPRSRFFIFETTTVDSLLSAPNDKRADKKRTLTMSRKAVSDKLAQYEDNWSIIR